MAENQKTNDEAKIEEAPKPEPIVVPNPYPENVLVRKCRTTHSSTGQTLIFYAPVPKDEADAIKFYGENCTLAFIMDKVVGHLMHNPDWSKVERGVYADEKGTLTPGFKKVINKAVEDFKVGVKKSGVSAKDKTSRSNFLETEALKMKMTVEQYMVHLTSESEKRSKK